MARYLVDLAIVINDKKITAIKMLREATGCSLLDAKNFCETRHPTEFSSSGGLLVLNADQVADVMVTADLPYVTSQPRFMVMSIKKLGEQGLDLSNIVR